MTKDILVLNGIIFFYLLQRLSELLISKNNEAWLIKNKDAVEADPRESWRMRIFHGTWFLGLLIEANLKREFQPFPTSLLIYFVLFVCLGVRLHTMELLKRYWTIKVFRMKDQIVATNGLYHYVRHPNYLIVILELCFIPLLMKAYFTMTVFSIINVYIQYKRIALEEETLMSQTNYAELFKKKNRLFPFILSLLLCWNIGLRAEDQVFHFKSYEEASKSESFIKFESTSTKFGLVTTSFDGYAKDFKISHDLKNDKLTKLDVIVPVGQLDTDSSGRNEKMVNEIMDVKAFPNIIVTINEPLLLKEGENEVKMTFMVKERKFVRPVKFIVKKDQDKIMVNGFTAMGLKEIGLPDPSIAIAKVRDLFDLKFSVRLHNSK